MLLSTQKRSGLQGALVGCACLSHEFHGMRCRGDIGSGLGLTFYDPTGASVSSGVPSGKLT